MESISKIFEMTSEITNDIIESLVIILKSKKEKESEQLQIWQG